jgi:hypothetical protein
VVFVQLVSGEHGPSASFLEVRMKGLWSLRWRGNASLGTKEDGHHIWGNSKIGQKIKQSTQIVCTKFGPLFAVAGMDSPASILWAERSFLGFSQGGQSSGLTT